MTWYRPFAVLLPLLALCASCAALQGGAPYPAHPFDAQLEGEWFYDCHYFTLKDGLPISLDGRALYFRGQSRELLYAYLGTDCADAGRILEMRFEGTYRLGAALQVALEEKPVQAWRDDEAKQRVTYTFLPTFASAVGEDAACQSLVGKQAITRSVAALAQCEVTKTFRELEERSAKEKTALYVDGCKLYNGSEEGGTDAEGYPIALDTRFYGVRLCKTETEQ